jgi:hypothetical protein
MQLGQDGRHDEVEREKQDLLQKQKEGKGHWKEQLASDSESIVCFLAEYAYHVSRSFCPSSI